MNPIDATIVAGKLHAIRNGEHPKIAAQIQKEPRLVEALWFIQWVSWQLGGLKALAKWLIGRDLRSLPGMDRIGPKTIHQFKMTEEKWSPEDCLAAWRQLKAEKLPAVYYDFLAFAQTYLDERVTVKAVNAGEHYNRERLQAGFGSYNWAYFYNEAHGCAEEELAIWLGWLCIHVDQPIEGPWYFRELVPAIFEYMAEHSSAANKELGSTTVAKLVFKRLDFGFRSKCPVMILGDSRAGKTKSISTWCKMRPGLARLITVPDSTSPWSFLAAHADALGIDYTEKTTERRLSRAVEYSLRHGGLYPVFDESHYLLPIKFSRNTAPWRLNWVRSHIVDQGLGAAFFSTRQSYHSAMQKYVKQTQYAMEQFIGRITPVLELPAGLDLPDMLTAVKTIFPTIDQRLLGYIAAKCGEMETGFRHLEAIVEYAIDHANQRGKAAPLLADVDAALDDFFPIRPIARAPLAAPPRPAREAVPTERISSPRSANLATPSRRMEADLPVTV